MFTKNHKIIDLVESDYNLLPVINRFGISLGNKENSIEKICRSLNINTEFFLLIINTFNSDLKYSVIELRAFSPLLIIEYLQKTHQYYIDYVLVKLDNLLHELIESDTSEVHQLEIIEKFYNKYKQELILHINEEEHVVFPYVTSLVNNEPLSTDYKIHSFEKEHSNVDIKLDDLKNLIIKYIEPVYNNNICNEFLITLFRFQKDICNHSRIEDNILIPQVQELEKMQNE